MPRFYVTGRADDGVKAYDLDARVNAETEQQAEQKAKQHYQQEGLTVDWVKADGDW
ncbi:hypothetical protein [Streptomyces uncialis]|uniref:hypothetical protein n=1 Tax=Streptomyces uncialis TaxID=1048205 RepID=UPI00224E8BC8|nr:hypothetical protein [Streptomyces uncialis]MCX4665054.1 hypothetical protein [Streptomyces uncialis]